MPLINYADPLLQEVILLFHEYLDVEFFFNDTRPISYRNW